MTLISKFSSTLATTLALLSTAYGLDIRENTIYRDLTSADFKDLYIEQGTFLTLLDIGQITNDGIFYNRGEFYVAADNYKAVNYAQTGSTFNNDGKISFDSRNSNDIGKLDIRVQDFKNDGEIWAGTSDSKWFPKISLQGTKSWENNGKISFAQSRGDQGDVAFTDLSFDITNNGVICLENVKWAQLPSVKGPGSITLGDNARIELNKILTIQDRQTISFSGLGATLYILGLTESLTGTRSYNVAGFGGDNRIYINLGYTSHSYEGDTLSLSFFLGLFKINFVIGEGYNADGFTNDGIFGGGFTIKYNGEAPSPVPEKFLCDPFPTPRTAADVTSSAASLASSALSSISSSLASEASSVSSELAVSASSVASSVSSAATSASSAVSSLLSASTSDAVDTASGLSASTSDAVGSASYQDSSSDAVGSASYQSASTSDAVGSASYQDSSSTDVDTAEYHSAPTTVTTDILTTNSDGSVSTITGEIIVTYGSDGLPTTHTEYSIVPSAAYTTAEPTTYTTDVVTTNSDGSVSTYPGEVIVSIGPDGKPTTVTAAPGVTAAPTTYTTGIATTNSDGSVGTIPAEIIVSVGPDGKPTTYTSAVGPDSTVTEGHTLTQWETHCPVCPGGVSSVSGWVYTKTLEGTVTLTTEVCPPGATYTEPTGDVPAPAPTEPAATETAPGPAPAGSTWTKVHHGTTESGVVDSTVQGTKTVYLSSTLPKETAPASTAPAPAPEGSAPAPAPGKPAPSSAAPSAPGAPAPSGAAPSGPAPSGPAPSASAPGEPAPSAPAPAPAPAPGSEGPEPSTVAGESTPAPSVAPASSAPPAPAVSSYEAGAAAQVVNYSWLFALAGLALF